MISTTSVAICTQTASTGVRTKALHSQKYRLNEVYTVIYRYIRGYTVIQLYTGIYTVIYRLYTGIYEVYTVVLMCTTLKVTLYFPNSVHHLYNNYIQFNTLPPSYTLGYSY